MNSIDGFRRGMSTGIISTDAIQDALQRAKEVFFRFELLQN